MPAPTGGLTECLDLIPGKELSFLGNCYLFLKQGSFEIKHSQDNHLEIKGCDCPPGDYFFDLRWKKFPVCFVETDIFVLKAGDTGCVFDLYYPPIEKKDWGVGGPVPMH